MGKSSIRLAFPTIVPQTSIHSSMVMQVFFSGCPLSISKWNCLRRTNWDTAEVQCVIRFFYVHRIHSGISTLDERCTIYKKTLLLEKNTYRKARLLAWRFPFSGHRVYPVLVRQIMSRKEIKERESCRRIIYKTKKYPTNWTNISR